MVSPLYDCFTSFNFKADHMMHLLQNLAKNVTMYAGLGARTGRRGHAEGVRAFAFGADRAAIVTSESHAQVRRDAASRTAAAAADPRKRDRRLTKS